MKTLILNNWKAKLASLLLATAIWYLIDSHIKRSKGPPRFPNPDYTPGQGLPPGEYVSGDGQERITVGDSGSIRFQVRVEGNKSVEMTDREFNSHQIWAQSKTIRPQPMKTRDSVHGIGRYTWVWNGGKIAKTSKSGKVLATFTRRN